MYMLSMEVEFEEILEWEHGTPEGFAVQPLKNSLI